MLDIRKPIVWLLASAAVLTGCADDGTGPSFGSQAIVRGRVEQTTPPPSPSGSAPAAPAATSSSSAQTVAVMQVEADGSLTELATAQVEADGSFTVEGVPASRSDLEVVAYHDGESVGSVLIHEESLAGDTIEVEPIDAETTLEARTYSDVRKSSPGGASTSSELALLVHADGASAETAASSQAEIDAVATAYASASSTLTAVYSMRDIALDASERARIVGAAAVDYATMRYGGSGLAAANEAFIESSLSAMVDAGVDLESTVMASAAAGSTFDAALNGASAVRGALAVQPLQMNLLARERLAASLSSTAEGSVALAIRDVLSDASANVLLVGGLVDLRALIGTTLDDVVQAGANACVELLAASADTSVQDEVRARATDALQTARLGVRLEAATTAQAAVAAMADYEGEVRTAVEAMIEASGDTTVDADVLTTAFIAASGGVYIH